MTEQAVSAGPLGIALVIVLALIIVGITVWAYRKGTFSGGPGGGGSGGGGGGGGGGNGGNQDQE